ncbi:MAG: hypothetical protein J6S67_05815 [Methanobrevibacter sp.]|nr:hypothetical protein [Methanobrevibacter sp.]
MEKLEKLKTELENEITGEVVITETWSIEDIANKINEIIEALNEITNK